MIIRHIELNLDPVLNFRSLKTSFIKLIHNNSLHLINTKLNEYEKNLLDSIPKFKSSISSIPSIVSVYQISQRSNNLRTPRSHYQLNSQSGEYREYFRASGLIRIGRERVRVYHFAIATRST